MEWKDFLIVQLRKLSLSHSLFSILSKNKKVDLPLFSIKLLFSCIYPAMDIKDFSHMDSLLIGSFFALDGIPFFCHLKLIT